MNGGLEILCRLNQTCSVSLANDSIVGYIDDGFGLENRLQLVKDTTCWLLRMQSFTRSRHGSEPLGERDSASARAKFHVHSGSVTVEDVSQPWQAVHSGCAVNVPESVDRLCAAPQGIVQALEPACLSEAKIFHEFLASTN
eukprot:Skav229481  [mRNA]  locus=scaffold4918:28803:30630:+ [translate_table: standard]